MNKYELQVPMGVQVADYEVTADGMYVNKSGSICFFVGDRDDEEMDLDLVFIAPAGSIVNKLKE